LSGEITKTSKPNLHARQALRLALFTLPVILLLSWMPPVKAESAQQAAGSPSILTEAGKESGSTSAGPAAGTHGSLPVDPGDAGLAGNNGQKDLTVFFSIGVVVDILLVAAFLYWAVGQWSRSRK